MTQRQYHQRQTEDDRFIAVSRPAETDGVARALQVAFRDGYELPTEFQQCLQELSRIRF